MNLVRRAIIRSGPQFRSKGVTLLPLETDNSRNLVVAMPQIGIPVPRWGHRPMPLRRTSALSPVAATDADLIARILNRDADALAEVYRQHGGAVFGLSRRVLGDESLAEDVTQELFLRLWNEPHRFDPSRGTLRSFLQRQAHSRSVERVRSEEARRKREDRSIAVDVRPIDDLESDVITSIESDRIRCALESLDPDERRPIVLAYYGGASYRDVAERLGLPEGTVKSRIRTGLRKLSSKLQTDGSEVER